MKNLTLLFSGLLILTGTLAFGQLNITAFYPHVDSLIQFPPPQESLAVMCQRKVGTLYVTLLRVRGQENLWIAAVTPRPEKNLHKKISLTVQFEGAHPSTGAISTWGYIFDRNGDGKIDYMALLGGAAPVKRDDFQPSFPYRGQPLTRADVGMIVGHAGLLFNHWADDNYDDTLDALIQIDMDPLRDWLQRHLVIRSTGSAERFDDVWGFPGRIDGDRDSVDHTERSVPYNPVGKTQPEEITGKSFHEKTLVLGMINHAFALCRLKPTSNAGAGERKSN